jgi:Domain of unknown function (DUF4402)
MKKTLAFALVLGSLAAASPAFAQAANTSTDTASGSVTIIRPLTLTKTTDLAFGRVVQPRSGTGTVSIANNSTTVVGGSGAVVLSGLTTSHAVFGVSGEGAQVVNVTSPATFDLSNGANTITVTLAPDWNTTTNQVTLSGSLGAAGSATLNLGGSFNLPSTQASGAYTGTFNVTVAYN